MIQIIDQTLKTDTPFFNSPGASFLEVGTAPGSLVFCPHMVRGFRTGAVELDASLVFTVAAPVLEGCKKCWEEGCQENVPRMVESGGTFGF